jgi:hypothetical protein
MDLKGLCLDHYVISNGMVASSIFGVIAKPRIWFALAVLFAVAMEKIAVP